MNAKNSNSPTSPRIQSFLLADYIYVDQQTSKMIIAGTFTHLWSHEFPSSFHRPTFAYLRFENCRSSFELQMRFVDLQDDSILMESRTIEVEPQSDPNAPVEFFMEVPPFPMPHEGWFELGAYCSEELLGRCRIGLHKIETEDKTDDSTDSRD